MHLRRFSSPNEGNGENLPSGSPKFDDSEREAMERAKYFVSGDDAPLTHIRSEEEWEAKVVNSDLPVVLFCHALWCNPSRKTLPMLQKKLVENEGKFRIVALDIDEVSSLANALEVRSMPTVMLIHEQRLVTRFQGVPSESTLNEFFDVTLQIGDIFNKTQTLESIIERAEGRIEEGSLEDAMRDL